MDIIIVGLFQCLAILVIIFMLSTVVTLGVLIIGDYIKSRLNSKE